MAARPRIHKITIPNLYCKLDKRTSKVYWQYRHPISGKFIGFGTDEETAKFAATEANRLIAEQESKQINYLVDMTIQQKTKIAPGIRVSEWIDKYLEIQNERVKDKEIVANTVRTRKSCALVLSRRLPTVRLRDVNTKAIADILEEYKVLGKSRMAQLIRSVWVDVFKEAQHCGEVDPGFNPVLATKIPKNKVSRSRLSLEEWKRIFEAAKNIQPYLANSMLLALVTGQRRGDIANMKFSDVWDGYLHITQSKTGMKLALPLTLTCNAIGLSLADVIGICRDRVISPYMVHHSRAHGSALTGQQVQENTISRAFTETRDKVLPSPEKGRTLPSFHEQRSLSERLYREQGINTQILLGHKNASQTDKYHDDRGASWTTLVI